MSASSAKRGTGDMPLQRTGGRFLAVVPTRQMSRPSDKCRARGRPPGGCAAPGPRRSVAAMVRPIPSLAVLVALAAAAPASAAPADHFTITVSPRPVHAGEPLTVRATAVDGAGAAMADYAGPARFTDSAASVEATFDHGVATAELDTGKPVHGEVVQVSTDDGSSSSSSPFDVLGPVTKLTVSVPGRSDAASPFTAVVTARDDAGSLVRDYQGVPSWSDDAGAFAGTQPAAFARGVSRTTLPSTAPVAGDVLTVQTADASIASRRFSRIGALDRVDL